MSTNAGDLARVTTHDPDDAWPTHLEIVAYWGYGHGRRGRRRSIQIDADQFFGRGQYGAPMPAEVLFGMIDRLRRQGGYGLRMTTRKKKEKKKEGVLGGDSKSESSLS